MKRHRFNLFPLSFPTALIALMIVGAFGYAYAYISYLQSRVDALSSELASTTMRFATADDSLSKNLLVLEDRTLGLSTTLDQRVNEINQQVGGVQNQLSSVSGTVGTLEKLAKTDPELLQKYSKVFFLNEHYTPERVTEIPKEHLYIERNPEVIHASVYPKLEALLRAAKADGETMYIQSAYRSFDEQSKLKGAYTVTYGAGTANTFSADQGYSEHQLGTTVDFITTGLGGRLEGFDGTRAYAWLLNNAHRYGFILSYPQGNGYYIFEPWHWRYVGVALATNLYDTGKQFYDLEQREIDEYLVKIFD